MGLRLQPTVVQLPSCSSSFHVHRFSSGSLKTKFLTNVDHQYAIKAKILSRRTVRTLSALPETAASVAVAATIVGAAATFLARKTKSSEESEAPKKICEECGGSGLCSECNGEGFVVKRMAEGSAEKARLMAKNMATRYTAGLPKKWSYCSKCSSGRSCSTCGGTGTL